MDSQTNIAAATAAPPADWIRANSSSSALLAVRPRAVPPLAGGKSFDAAVSMLPSVARCASGWADDAPRGLLTWPRVDPPVVPTSASDPQGADDRSAARPGSPVAASVRRQDAAHEPARYTWLRTWSSAPPTVRAHLERTRSSSGTAGKPTSDAERLQCRTRWWEDYDGPPTHQAPAADGRANSPGSPAARSGCPPPGLLRLMELWSWSATPAAFAATPSS